MLYSVLERLLNEMFLHCLLSRVSVVNTVEPQLYGFLGFVEKRRKMRALSNPNNNYAHKYSFARRICK